MDKVELLTIAEAAKRIGIATSSLVQQMAKDKFTTYQHGKSARLLRSDEVAEFIEQRSEGVSRMPVETTETHAMLVIECSDCGAMFEMAAVDIAQVFLGDDEVSCPVCGEEIPLPELKDELMAELAEDDGEDEDEDEGDDEGEGEAGVGFATPWN